MAAEKIRILIVDDHALFREGIGLIIQSQGDMEVVGEASSGEQAIEAARELRPDVVLMDITMPGGDGLEPTLRIKQNCPETQVLMLTMHESEDYFFRSLLSGASGYVLKEAVSSSLLTAIRAVAQGQVFLYPSVAKKLLADYLDRMGGRRREWDRLTHREREVLGLIAQGCCDKRIAELLVVSPNTVQSHRWHIMEKLDLHHRAELINYALRQGLIDPTG